MRRIVCSAVLSIAIVFVLGFLTSCDAPDPKPYVPAEPDTSPLVVTFERAPDLGNVVGGFVDVFISNQGRAIALDTRRQVYTTEEVSRGSTWVVRYTVPSDDPPPTAVAIEPSGGGFFIGHECANGCYTLVERTSAGDTRLRAPRDFAIRMANGEVVTYPIRDAIWETGLVVGTGRNQRGGGVYSLPSPLVNTWWTTHGLRTQASQSPQPAYVGAVGSDGSSTFYASVNYETGTATVSADLLQKSFGGDTWLSLYAANRGFVPAFTVSEQPLAVAGRGVAMALWFSTRGLIYKGSGMPYRRTVVSGLQGTTVALALDPQRYLWVATSVSMFRSREPMP